MTHSNLNTCFKRIIVKVGTSTLTGASGEIDLEFLDSLARQIATLKSLGLDVLLVTSGSIRAGMEKMGFTERPSTIPEKQAAAAVGQGHLMRMYLEAFSKYGILVGQVLLTREDFGDRKRYLNARNTLFELFRHGVLPIVNENDTIATDEIKVGDNDTLAALVAANLEADLLILLSDVPGLYDRKPNGELSEGIIHTVTKIDSRIRSIAGGAGSQNGTGGMRTKIEAGIIATNCGVTMCIAHGRHENILIDIASGAEAGTKFLPRKEYLCGRKKWIAFGASPRGSIVINDGAKAAVCENGKSLLAAGVTDVSGRFSAGSIVKLVDQQGNQLAIGFVNYSADDILKVMGRKSSEIDSILGHKDFDEIVHRDNMVLRP